MPSFDQIFNGLVAHPTELLLALALVALYFMWKTWRDDTKEHAAEIAALHKEHLATAMTVVPLTQQVVRCVEFMERKA